MCVCITKLRAAVVVTILDRVREKLANKIYKIRCFVFEKNWLFLRNIIALRIITVRKLRARYQATICNINIVPKRSYVY